MLAGKELMAQAVVVQVVRVSGRGVVGWPVQDCGAKERDLWRRLYANRNFFIKTRPVLCPFEGAFPSKKKIRVIFGSRFSQTRLNSKMVSSAVRMFP